MLWRTVWRVGSWPRGRLRPLLKGIVAGDTERDLATSLARYYSAAGTMLPTWSVHERNLQPALASGKDRQSAIRLITLRPASLERFLHHIPRQSGSAAAVKALAC